MLLLVVASLAQIPRSQAACQPSRRLSPREMAARAKPAFPVPRRLMTLGRQEPRSPRLCGPGIPHPAVRPSLGRTTHFPGHPGWATFIPAGASTPQWTSCWLERKAEAELYEVAIFLGQGRENSFIFMWPEARLCSRDQLQPPLTPSVHTGNGSPREETGNGVPCLGSCVASAYWAHTLGTQGSPVSFSQSSRTELLCRHTR